MKVFVIIVFLLQSIMLSAQNLTGVWEGVFRTDIVPNRSRSFFLHMEIRHTGNRVQAVFFNALPETPGKPAVMYRVNGRLSKSKSPWPLTLYSNRIIQDRLPNGVADAFNAFVAEYIKNDTAELLYGTWQPGIPAPRPDGAGGIFWARRVDSAISEYAAGQMEPDQPDTPQTVNTTYPLPFEQRKEAVADRLLIADSMVTISIIDDALTDGDTVSLFFNGQNIGGPIALSAIPWRITLPLEKNETCTLHLFAHNSGAIPPNTALLRLEWKGQIRELTLASNGLTNAALVLERWY